MVPILIESLKQLTSNLPHSKDQLDIQLQTLNRNIQEINEDVYNHGTFIGIFFKIYNFYSEYEQFYV